MKIWNGHNERLLYCLPNNIHQTVTPDDVVKEQIPLIDWLMENVSQHGCRLSFVSNSTTEGSQFCKGFGGLGGLLRYAMTFNLLSEDEGDFSNDDEFIWTMWS